MEQWRSIPGYEGLYEASTTGGIRSVERRVPKMNHGTMTDALVPARELRADIGKLGYMRVTLFVNGCRNRQFVHRLVLSTFVGQAPDGFEANHRNGNRGDNRLENLEWVTRRENLRHSFDQLGRRSKGRSLPGARNNRAKTIDTDRVFALRADGWSQQAIADAIGVNQTMISYVLRGGHWSQREARG